MSPFRTEILATLTGNLSGVPQNQNPGYAPDLNRNKLEAQLCEPFSARLYYCKFRGIRYKYRYTYSGHP